MEAVPKLPMLSFELKISPENTHFSPKLKQYISEAYREDPDSYSNEIHQLEGLRSAAVRPATDTSGLAALNRYFSQLRSMQSRFPMAMGQPAAVTFTWKDLYAHVNSSYADIRFEMACIMYNIGALHTQLGASEPRDTQDSLKAACTHFQKAAWAFQHLKENYPQQPGVDAAQDMMKFFQEICFAQAQECVLEKSILDTTKPSVIGAFATQVAHFYRNSLALLGPSSGHENIYEIIGSKIYNNWFHYLSFKCLYIGCIVSLYHGMNAEEVQKMGERVAFYQQAVDRLNEARKLAKHIEPTKVTQDAMTFTNDVVEGKRKAAKNENEFIYHEAVPDGSVLAEMKPICVIKALPINFNDPEIAGKDLLSRLVPLGAHEASSVYSEEKAKLLRHVVSMVEQKNTVFTEFMSSLQLEQLDVLDSDKQIPLVIVDRCAAMNARPDIIQSLVDSMNNLAEIISDVENSLADIKVFIQAENDKEKEYQKVMGPRPPSIVQTELSREYNKYQEAHSRTNESNQVLHKAMTLHVANLRLLALPLEDLRNKIPSIDRIEGLDFVALAEMKRVVAKAREMQTQRALLVAQLRSAITADDITARLLAAGSDSLNEIYKQEMEKHTPQVKIIEQNLAAQDNIINKLTTVYASYAESRRLLSDVIRKRESVVSALTTSYDSYEELLAKSQKGLDFYKRMSHNVAQLLSRLRSTCQVQEEERSQHLSKQPGKVSAPTSVKNTNNPVASTPATMSSTPKLKDYLPYMKVRGYSRNIPSVQPESMPTDAYYPENVYPTSVRPAPVGSEATSDPIQMRYPDGYVVSSNHNVNTSIYGQYSNMENNQYQIPTNYPTEAKPGLPYDQNIQKVPESENINYGYANAQQYVPQQYYTNPQDNVPIMTDPQMVMNQTPQNPYMYAEQYDTVHSSYTPIPEALSSIYANQTDISNNIAQMQISAAKPDPANNTGVNFNPDYTQSYYMTQISTPNAPFSAEQTASNYNYQYGNQNPNMSQVYSPQPSISSGSNIGVGNTPELTSTHSYVSNSNYDNQNYAVNTDAINNTTMPTGSTNASVNHTVDGYSNYSAMTAGSEKVTRNITLGDLDSIDKPIKSHVTGQALSSNVSSYQSYNPYEANNATSVSNYSNVDQTSQAYSCTEAASNADYSYQNHPGYGFNPVSGTYDYNYGSQSSTNQSSQNMNNLNWPQQGIYTNSSYNESVQSPSDSQNIPQSNVQSDNSSYYSSPYGYQTVDQSVSNVSVVEPETTSLASSYHQSTYMQSGQSHDTTVTFTSQQGQQVSASMTRSDVTESDNSNYTQNNQSTNVSTQSVDQPPQNLQQQESNVTNIEDANTEDQPKMAQDAKHKFTSFDLLSEIDFSVEQTPLLPQIKVPQISEITMKRYTPSEFEKVIPKVEDVVERPAKNDLFSDPTLVNKFTQEVKNLQKFVDSLTDKSVGGLTVLDNKWKQYQDLQAKENMVRTKTIAMENSNGNIVTDVVPFDDSRLILKSNPDAYINASYYKQLAPWCIPLIISKFPSEDDHGLFWKAVMENKISCIVCLLSEIEIQGNPYWPTAKGQMLQTDGLRVTLEEVTCGVHWTERRLTVAQGKVLHRLVHYQISVFPVKIACSPLVLLADKILSVTYDNKLSNQLSCAWVHCSKGAGRSSVIALLLMAICQVRAGQLELYDMVDAACANLCKQRANVLEDTKYLADAYRTILFFVQGVLFSGTTLFNGETVAGPSGASVMPPVTPTPAASNTNSKTQKFSRESFEEMKQSPGLKSGDMKDPLNFLDPLWSLKKN